MKITCGEDALGGDIMDFHEIESGELFIYWGEDSDYRHEARVYLRLDTGCVCLSPCMYPGMIIQTMEEDNPLCRLVYLEGPKWRFKNAK